MDGKRDNPNFGWVIGRSCQSTKRLLIMKCCGCQESNVLGVFGSAPRETVKNLGFIKPKQCFAKF